MYGRVSHPNQNSVASQLNAGRAWAEQHHKRVVGEYSDDGVSAWDTRKDRPDWRRVMQELALGAASYLWCWEISRSTRDREVWAKLIRTCQANDVQIVVGDRAHDPNDPDDGFMLDLTAALAIRESAVTRKRIKRDVEDRAAAGRPHGKIPYGYRREYDPTSGKLLRQVPNEDTAPIVAELARRVLAGESMYAIAHDLTRRGVPSPETVRRRRMHGPDTPLLDWYPSEIKDQLVSPTNAGLRVHQGVVVADATWPAILSVTDQAALLQRLSTPKNYRDGATRHLLTGIAECGVCGATVRLVKNRGYPSYACRGLQGRGDSCVIRIQPPVDTLVEEAVIAFCEDPTVLERLLAATGDGAEAAAAAVELAELQARLDAFISSASSPDGISPDTLARIESGLRPQIADARARSLPRSLPAVVVSMFGPAARAVWMGMEVPVRRQVVRFLLRVIIHRTARGRGTRGFDPERIQLVWLVGAGAG